MRFRLAHKLFESKADEQKLIDHVGEDLAKRFFNVKQRLQGQEKDLYYWLKKDPVELEDRINEIESTKTRSDKEKEAREGAKLVAENEYYKVYHITTYEASVKYGKGTQWCISGSKRWSNGEHGEEYFNDYTDKGIEFYFFIPKTNENEKYAIAFAPSTKKYQIFNETDNEVEEIPDAPTVEGVYKPIGYRNFNVDDFDFEDAELLTLKRAESLPRDVLKYDDWWWLCSPGYRYPLATYVTIPGGVDYIGDDVTDSRNAVRPALIISNLRDYDLKPYDKIKINGTKFIVISPARVLYNDELMYHRFDLKSNDYEKSEIKQFVDNWFDNFINQK